MNISDLWKKYPWKSINKFLPIATRHGFSKQDVTKFQKTLVKDRVKPDQSQFHLPIYGSERGSYQFDTLIQSRANSTAIPAFLIIIDINSRFAYAYAMNNKGTSEVLRALNKFVSEARVKPTNMTSDQDKAYLTSSIIDFFRARGIEYRTTEDNNHNVLGIVNRFIRTLRDFMPGERDFTEEAMKEFIEIYNSSVHSSIGMAPKDFTAEDEKKYIEKMDEKTIKIQLSNDFDLHEGDRVRIVLESGKLRKKRSKLSEDYFLVHETLGNGYLIKAADESVAFYPRFRLVKSDNGKLGKTLDDDKRGIVTEILSYDARKDLYTILYSDGSKDKVKAMTLRERNPTSLSAMETVFWRGKNKNEIPSKIRELLR